MLKFITNLINGRKGSEKRLARVSGYTFADISDAGNLCVREDLLEAQVAGNKNKVPKEFEEGVFLFLESGKEIHPIQN